MVKQFTAQDIITTLRDWGGVNDSPEAATWLDVTIGRMNAWLARGDGIAVYEDQDMGHRELGDKRFVSYGSTAAQLETDTPPDRLPDGIGGTINWRYGLIGTYKGDPLVVDA